MDRAYVVVCGRLKAQRVEIERTILARIDGSSTDRAVGGRDPSSPLADAVESGVEYGLLGMETGGGAGPVPAALIRPARDAVRRGTSLESILRDYFVGYTLFCDFVIRAAEEDEPSWRTDLRHVLRIEATLLERVLIAVAAEHARQRNHSSPNARQLDLVKRMLAGEAARATELTYELEDWHVGAIAQGSGAQRALRGIAASADRRLLLVQPDPETVWAWFGGRHRTPADELIRNAGRGEQRDALVALGESARGIEGWRLTHRQASAAFDVAQRGSEGVVRYADVGLLASIAQDRLLRSSLQQLYLDPLTTARDGGVALRRTLRAYFEAGRNVSSAASALGVSRQTVGSRLRAVEEMLGRTLESCAPEVEVALRLEAIGGFDTSAERGSSPEVST